jgi:hypothetical protein
MIPVGFMLDAKKNAILAAIFNGGSMPTLPATLYLALSSAPPTRAGSFTELPATLNYSRTAIASTTGDWTVPALGKTTSVVQINIPAPIGGIWSTAVGWGLYDAASGGTLWFAGTTLPTTYTTTSTPFVAAAALNIQL